MALCLFCHGDRAKVVASRPAYVDGELIVWRVLRCPPEPDGCGTLRRQLIRDDGATERRGVPRTGLWPTRRAVPGEAGRPRRRTEDEARAGR